MGQEELAQLEQVIASGNLFHGAKVQQFRQEFAEMFGVKYAVTSTSGTAAIHVGVAMINPSPGDEIITSSITDIGTIIPIIYQNAIHKQFQICTPKADDDIVPIGGLDHSGWDSDSQNTILKIRIELSFAYRQQCGPPALARAALLENHLGAIIMIPFPDGDESES